jgi:hypothetical protein
MKISHVVLYTWEIYLTPLAKLDFLFWWFLCRIGETISLRISVHVAPSTITTYKIAKQLEETLSIYDKRLKRRKRKASTMINIDVISSRNLVNQFKTIPPKSFILT